MSELLDEASVTDAETETGVSDATEADSPESSGAAEDSPESEAVASLTPEQQQQLIDERVAAASTQFQQGFAQQLAAALGVGQQENQPPPVPDPWDEAYAEKMAERDQWFLRQNQAQIEQALAPYQQQQTESLVNDAVAQAVEAHKDAALDPDDVNRAGAAFFTDHQGDVRAAAKAGAEWLAAYKKSAGDAAVKAYQESLKTNLDQPADPAATGAGMQATPAAKTYDEILARHEARQNVEEYRT